MSRRAPAAAVSAITLTALVAGAVQWATAEPAGQGRPAPTRADRLAEQLVKTRVRLDRAERRVRVLERDLRHAPSVQEAIGLASVVYNVPRGTLLAVAACESGLRPAAENPTSTASGLFQFLYWHRTRLGAAGFSGHSPYAQAFQAAEWIRERGLAPWYASRHCWGGAR